MGFCSDKAAAKGFSARINLKVNKMEFVCVEKKTKGGFCLILGDRENKRSLKLGHEEIINRPQF